MPLVPIRSGSLGGCAGTAGQGRAGHGCGTAVHTAAGQHKRGSTSPRKQHQCWQQAGVGSRLQTLGCGRERHQTKVNVAGSGCPS